MLGQLGNPRLAQRLALIQMAKADATRAQGTANLPPTDDTFTKSSTGGGYRLPPTNYHPQQTRMDVALGGELPPKVPLAQMPLTPGDLQGLLKLSQLLRRVPNDLLSRTGVNVPTSLVDRLNFADKASRRTFKPNAEGIGFSGSRTADEVRALRESIQREGIKDAIGLHVGPNKDIVISDGSHRLAIAKELGLPEIPIGVTPNTIDQPGRLETLIQALGLP